MSQYISHSFAMSDAQHIAAFPPLSKTSSLFQSVQDVPLAGALAVGPRAGVPDRLVRHVGWLCVGFAMSLLCAVSVFESDIR
jgi:hypothetical protein